MAIAALDEAHDFDFLILLKSRHPKATRNLNIKLFRSTLTARHGTITNSGVDDSSCLVANLDTHVGKGDQNVIHQGDVRFSRGPEAARVQIQELWLVREISDANMRPCARRLRLMSFGSSDAGPRKSYLAANCVTHVHQSASLLIKRGYTQRLRWV